MYVGVISMYRIYVLYIFRLYRGKCRRLELILLRNFYSD